ncbi:hypothetical protein [Flavihumibacter petaseus]|uniref:Tetratricopeptide repeat protein n=1 Tax=Flavihumibacter petaseus NBRC 106054 TaxID=1220578 RepID=A0A0E9N335_9BACT|nr:hypothetical protein [Flavihumibacter petaseus]GAO44372.1 hypothetical protein FPE01S_03_04100 [Flavihumibacter petaseus NBRC 106054]
MLLAKTIPFYFRQPTLESVSIPELERAISKHPYAASLQLLLLKKQQQEKDPGFNSQWDKCSLYFPNPYLLQTVLSETSVWVKPAAEPVSPLKTEQYHVADPVVPEPEALVKSTVTEAVAAPAPEVPAEPESPVQSTEDNSTLRSDILSRESPIPIPGLKDILPQTDSQPLFEPYHTIDYFASQGIKLSTEVAPGDKLGKQLKSFTEWIRTMKKLPAPRIEQQLMDAGNGEKIQEMAAGSVQHREILTETMAEVLVKQGNIQKAIELYAKLSLAHPDKSAYFATRIEQLKQH